MVIPADRVLDKLDQILRKNDYTSAKNHLLYWLSEAETIGDDKGILLICNELMGLCRKLNEEEQAFNHVQRALNQIRKMQIETNIGAATTYLNSATVYKAFGKAKEALSLFEKARVIYEANLPSEDERLGGLYNNMALAMVDLKQFNVALELYEKAICVMRKNDDKEPEQAITYLNMATAFEQHYGLENAQMNIAEYINKAMALLDACKNRTDGNYAFICEKCASVFGYYGYFSYEKELTQRYRRIYAGT